MRNQTTIFRDPLFNRVDKDAAATMLKSAPFERDSGVRARLVAVSGNGFLTARECDVLERIASGSSNKEAAHELGISPRTVEVHRARIMVKLGARNAADLVRIVLSDGYATLKTLKDTSA